MKQIRATIVTKAAVQYQGVMTSGGPVKLQPGKGGSGPVPVKVSVQDVIAQIRAKFDITITAQLKAAGAIVGIDLLDHIIFNRSGYWSFLEEGRL